MTAEESLDEINERKYILIVILNWLNIWMQCSVPRSWAYNKFLKSVYEKLG